MSVQSMLPPIVRPARQAIHHAIHAKPPKPVIALMAQTAPRLRDAELRDVPAMTALINHYADLGEMLPRTEEAVRERLAQFIVVEVGAQVVACGALHHWDEQSAEIRSLAVHEAYAGQGLGRLMVERLVAMGVERGYEYAFALTLKIIFFEKVGFHVVPKHVLPQKIWNDCVICPFLYNCHETAMMQRLQSKEHRTQTED